MLKNIRHKVLYIPLWYDSNLWDNPDFNTIIYLYIPLWYDSNVKEDTTIPFFRLFTFHSGTILMNF